MAARAGDGEVSVIVPAWRDTGAVGALLESTRTWSPAPCEIVVVSAERDPALAALCSAYDARYVESRRSRGAQLDLGARSASAPVLWFLHADSSAPRDGIAAIRRALDAGAESGCFTFAFQGGRAWYKTAIELGVAARVRLGGIAYGDQGLFATRAAYEACGGFADQPLFEEARLVRRLRRRGTFRVLPERIGVSTRRWERDGWLKRTVENRWLALRYACGAPPERLAAAYVRRDRPDRRSAS
ncbi:MAG TPA: TIGR04283 family arsenosugar biosynthesis glycosyltransferase [Gammaproteobacteria bacterium]